MNVAKYNKGYNFILVGSFGFLVNYFTNNLLARHLSIAEYGDLSLGLQYLVIVASLVYMGLVTTTKVYLPLYLKKNQKNRVVHYKSWSSLWVFRNAAIFCLILFALYLVFYLMILLGWMGFQDIHLVFFLLLAVPFCAIFKVIASYFSGDNAAIVSDILQQLVSPLIILLVLLLFLVESAQLSTLQLVVIYTFSYGLVFCVSWFLYTYFFSRKDLFRQAAVDFEGKVDEQSKWKYFSYQVMISSLIYNLFSSGPYLVLQLVSLYDVQISRSNDLGLYSACAVIASALWVVINNLYLGIYPKISSVGSSSQEASNLNREIAKTSVLGFLIIFVFLILIGVLGKVFLNHFGASYIQAYPILLGLSITPLIYIFGGVSGSILQDTGHIKLYNKILIGSMLFFYVLSPVLTYYYSLMGMVIAINVAWAVKVILNQYYARKLTSIKGLGFM